MRRIFHTCVLEWAMCDLYIFTGLDVYGLQDQHDLPQWNKCDLDDMYTLTEIRSARFAGSVLSAGFLYGLEDL